MARCRCTYRLIGIAHGLASDLRPAAVADGERADAVRIAAGTCVDGSNVGSIFWLVGRHAQQVVVIMSRLLIALPACCGWERTVGQHHPGTSAGSTDWLDPDHVERIWQQRRRDVQEAHFAIGQPGYLENVAIDDQTQAGQTWRAIYHLDVALGLLDAGEGLVDRLARGPIDSDIHRIAGGGVSSHVGHA